VGDGPVFNQSQGSKLVDPRVTYVALSADHLLAVELGGESLERWLDDTTTETENKVECRFLKYFSQPLGPEPLLTAQSQMQDLLILLMRA
jgi:hypothetical protein